MQLLSNVCSLVNKIKLPGLVPSTEPTNVPVEMKSITNDNVIVIKKKRMKKSTKLLDTCKTCGHYRFARTNGRRIVNPDYPYEHSSKVFTCPVEEAKHIPYCDQLIRLCECHHCVIAAGKFNHNPPRFLKYKISKTKNSVFIDDKRTDKLYGIYLRNQGFYKYGGKWFKR
jgi:hypothetical protein